jgi:secreted PhoX family phosphatase
MENSIKKSLVNSRREFLKFLGVSGVALTNISLISTSLTSCSSFIAGPTLPSTKDDLILKAGLSFYPLISWGDKINKDEVFGFNNDFITYKPVSKDELIMWVNHEYAHPLFVSSMERTKENVDIERSLVGGSIIKIKKEKSKWTFKKDDSLNRGVRGDTPIDFAYGVEVHGSKTAIGTCSNCAGGYTPWDTFLTCEENSDKNYGSRDKKTGLMGTTRTQWESFYPNPIEHYQWVVEVDPETGKAQKHTNLGRFGHESATCHVSKSGKVIVYSGDDKAGEHVYKFVSKNKKDFKNGVLYAADTINGVWLPLDLELSPILKKHFKNHLDVMINAREASKILGATPLNRPEDIEIHPHTGEVYITLTKNPKAGDHHGQILKITESNDDHAGNTFKASSFIMGGMTTGFACPDNLAFDKNGNLWMTSDISGGKIETKHYKGLGNNGLFVIPTSGENAGNVIQVGSAPVDAELTGICFSPDQKQLFLSVQHPGELTKDLKDPTSHWPRGGVPRPTVVVIEGEYLESLTQ